MSNTYLLVLKSELNEKEVKQLIAGIESCELLSRDYTHKSEGRIIARVFIKVCHFIGLDKETAKKEHYLREAVVCRAFTIYFAKKNNPELP